MNEQTDTQKRGRGRPSGSNSFETITLAELNARFNLDQKIPVGRIFLSGKRAKEISKILKSNNDFPIVPPPQELTIEMKLTQ